MVAAGWHGVVVAGSEPKPGVVPLWSGEWRGWPGGWGRPVARAQKIE
jgi:hypothetical protein